MSDEVGSGGRLKSIVNPWLIAATFPSLPSWKFLDTSIANVTFPMLQVISAAGPIREPESSDSWRMTGNTEELRVQPIANKRK